MIIKLTDYYQRIKTHLFESNHTIINWSDFDKGVLLLIFGIMSHLNTFMWYYPNFHSPENAVWFQSGYYVTRMTILWVGFCFFVALTFLSIYFKNVPIFRQILSYAAPILFAAELVYSGYSIGIYSPATMAGTVNLILVGFVFYSRKLIYIIIFPVVISIVLLCYFTSKDYIDYAPVFTSMLNDSALYHNNFWLGSMAQLYLPILIFSVAFVEILLSQWRRREKNIEHMSQTDALTNVFNRRYIGSQLIQLEKNTSTNYAVVLLDLDHFKDINDHYGHEVGDCVLKQIAGVLTKVVRENDIVGRFGGEEFILILKNQNLEQATEVAERCRLAIQNEKIILDQDTFIQITASFGVALSKGSLTKETVTRLADQALYQAKAAGRNLVCQAL